MKTPRVVSTGAISKLASGLIVLAIAMAALWPGFLIAQETRLAATSWVDANREAPAGMTYQTLHSNTIDGEFSYLVHLPPSYETAKEKRYPVVYWLHGLGGNQRACAAFVQRLSSAITAGQAPEMVVIGVNGLGSSRYTDSFDGKRPIETVIVKDLVPHVDQTYRTIASRDARGLEGQSMGGQGSAYLGFKYPEVFGVVSTVGAAVHDADAVQGGGDPKEWDVIVKSARRKALFEEVFGGKIDYFNANNAWTVVEKNADAIRGKTNIRLMVGDKDPLLGPNRRYHELLERLRIPHSFHVAAGAPHSFPQVYDKLGSNPFQFYLDAFAGVASKPAGSKKDAFAPVLSDVPDIIRPDHECPVAWSREPLRYYNGEIIKEGHRLILDADSYPRGEGRLVNPPAAKKARDGWSISFALDKPDDVEVRIVARDGAVIRRLGCGVLGPNAPEPFRKDSLEQEIAWDGRDAKGQPAPEGWQAQVRVGLRPRFEQFIGYDRTNVVPQLIGLEVDPQGRLYVATSAQTRSDPTIVRFDRDGSYLDMVYPPDPKQLGDQKIEALYRCGEYLDGRPVPTRARSWTQYFYQWPVGVMMPFRMDSEGNGFVAEILSGWGAADTSSKTPYRVFPTGNSDRFWFLQNVTLLQSSGAFTLDGKGGAYLAARAFELSKGSSAFDWDGIGRIRKINLATGQPEKAFSWNGDEKLAEPSEFLGAAYPKPEKARADRKMPASPTAGNTSIDSASRFLDIKDLAIDKLGRLLVVDSRPRRIKVFEPNGKFAGVLDRIAVGGVAKNFADIRALRVVGDDLYLLASLENSPLGLIKCSGDALSPAFVWQMALSPTAQYLAVDAKAAPRVIWCGNGKGPGTFTRVVDEGARAGEPRHIGGTKPRTFAFPCSIAAHDDGQLFIYDLVRKKIIRTDDKLAQWQELDAPFETPTLYVDRVGRRLLVTTINQVRAYGLDLAPIKELTFKSGTNAVWSTRSGGAFGGVDREGNLYACDGLDDKEAKSRELTGQIRRYGSDGVLLDGALAKLTFPSGSIALDSRNNLYALDLAYAEQWTQVSHNLPVGLGRDGVGAARLMFRRGDRPVWQQSDLCYLVKFGPDGGVRNTASEHWSHRGFSPHSAGGCKCDWPRGVLAIDAADRIFGADAIHHHVKVLDTAGNLITRLGWWGNAQTVPKNGDAREFGFWNIYSLTATGDALYVCDKDLRRIAKFRMDYREVMSAAAD